MSLADEEIRAEEFLAKAPLFARLDSRGLRRLAALCVPRTYQVGEEIVTEGSTGLGLFVVTDGRVEVIKGFGEDRVVLAELGPGDIIGEMALIDDQPRSATIHTLEPTSCLLITRSSFQSLVDQEPDIAWCIVPTLATRVRALQEELIAGQGAVRLTDTLDVQPAPAEEDDDKNGDPTRALLHLLRGQHALALALAAGMRGFAEATESFLRTLARETDLSDSDDLEKVIREIPRGLADATENALEQVERLPERMLSRYRRARGRRRN
jgi:CRP/FNR family transcriptional regulator/CRP/FNR family cyclic AMP-dependent transcriptional regulator